MKHPDPQAHRPRLSARSARRLCVAVGLGLLAAACTSPGPSARLASTPATLEIQSEDILAGLGGDEPWAAVDAAVDAGAKDRGMIITQRDDLGTDFRLYHLQTQLDEPGRIRAQRLPDGVRLRAQIGRFGDERASERLLRAIRSAAD